MSELEEAKQAVSKLEDQLEAVYKQLTPLKNKQTRISKKLTKALESLDKLIVPSLTTFEERLKHFIPYNFRETTYHYKETRKFFGDIGLMTNGYYRDTMQVALQFKAESEDTDEHLESLAVSIETCLEVIKENKEGIKALSIAEKTCSEHGIYTLRVEGERIYINLTVYSRDEVVEEFDSVYQALLYIRKHHYY